MVMQHYLDEELVITKEDMACAYLRPGPKANDLLSGKGKVIFLILPVLHIKTFHSIGFRDSKVNFPLNKGNGKTGNQAASAASVVAARSDPELEQLESSCYEKLLDCCKTLADMAGVNYTTIMNLQVRA